MKHIHKWSVVLAMLLVGLVACQPATPEATAPPPTATATAVLTSTSVLPTATPAPSPTAEPTSEPPAAEEATPTREPVAEAEATPTRPWQIPGVTDEDHGKGNPDAGMVLVEYSDFQ